MSKMPEITCLVEAKDVLGEGPIWNPRESALYWVDNLRPCVWRYDPITEKVDNWTMPEPIGSLVFREKGGMVAAMQTGFHFLDLVTGRLERIVDPEPDLPQNRMNDGKCDRRGRYWCGSMNPGFANATASLYRLDPDLSCHRMDTNIIVSNGMAWSPDDRTMYFADTRAETVYSYDFDVDTGAIRNRRTFISTKDMPGRVDGATVDAEGFYWCALIHDWTIGRFDPHGRLDRAIRMPVRHPTMCTFGGEKLDVLYVTSTTKFLEPGEAEQQPLAGALFAIHDVGVRGLPEPFFRG
jgi:sugar lactone lactonase YvrE